VRHFSLARLGSEAQLQVIESVEPHLKFRRETVETDRENISLKIWQRCPQQCRKTRLRRSSDRIWRTADAAKGSQSAGRFTSGRDRQKEGGGFGQSGTESPKRQGGVAVTEPPGGRERSQDRNQPPDGTGRQHGNQAMKAGPSRTTEQPITPTNEPQGSNESSLSALSGKAIAQVVRNQSRRAWGWWKHRPHLLSKMSIIGIIVASIASLRHSIAI
jgi:hypothetical protein